MIHGNEAGKQYKSEVMADIHAAAQDLRDLNLISKETMAEFDKNCLTPIEPMTPEEIRALRDREATSQAVFALYLNVSPGLVSEWERGETRPGGPSAKLLALVKAKGLEAVA